MTDRSTWGSWTLSIDGATLLHEGGYGIEVHDIGGELDAQWWADHLAGKGWVTPADLDGFHAALRDLFSTSKLPTYHFTDAQIAHLAVEEGRAYLATVRNAEQYDKAPADALIANGHHLLREWNTARTKLRAAVLDRLQGDAA